MKKLKMESVDIVGMNIEKIRLLFPYCITEVKGIDGRVTAKVDFELLKQELSNDVVEGTQERYQLNWPGKREALVVANTSINKTLRPVVSESSNFEETKNLFIEGDNLDALKLLQESYLGKVKAIYIDPPYNTGHDFIYEDNFSEKNDDFLRRSNQIDESGIRMVANTESNGRFHSDWLSMMFPRLKLARNLLREDGVIFISIHDVELANLKKLCEEIFGQENFVGQITWKARVKPVNIGEAKYRPQREVEYVLVFQKSYVQGTFKPLYTGGERSYPHSIEGRKYRLTTILKSNRGANYRTTMSFALGDYTPPEGQRWQAGEDVINQLQKDGYLEFRDGTPFKRYFEDEEGAEHDPFYCFMESDWSSTSEAGKNQLNEILGDQHGFDTVKPVRLIKTLLQTCTAPNEGHIVLDFFAGSATTAQAIFEINAEDGGDRRLILVQIPEPCLTKSKSTTAAFKNIAEISKQRIRISGSKIADSDCNEKWNKDIGFRVLHISSSNMSDVYYNPDAVSQDLLSEQEDNVRSDRTAEDLLFQVLLDWGVDLSLPIANETIQGKSVFFVDQNALVACFDKQGGVDEDFVKELAKRQPLRVVFRDAGFKSDSVKINVEQIFKLLSPSTEVKCI